MNGNRFLFSIESMPNRFHSPLVFSSSSSLVPRCHRYPNKILWSTWTSPWFHAYKIWIRISLHSLPIRAPTFKLVDPNTTTTRSSIRSHKPWLDPNTIMTILQQVSRVRSNNFVPKDEYRTLKEQLVGCLY